MAQRTFSKMGRVNVMAALCAALAALFDAEWQPVP